MSDPDSVESVIKDVIKSHGKIDNLVTSAGFTENFDAIAYPYDRVKKLWGGKRPLVLAAVSRNADSKQSTSTELTSSPLALLDT